jgi:hypothetical protein
MTQDPTNPLGPFESRCYPIEEDMAAQLVTWRVERVAWGCFGLIVGAALLGAFGDGLLSRTTAGDVRGKLHIEYARIERQQAASTFRIRASGLAPGGEASIQYGRALAEGRSFRTVEPRPSRTSGDAAGLLHVYTVPDSGLLEVQVEYQPLRPGLTAGTIGLGGGPALTLHQVVLP